MRGEKIDTRAVGNSVRKKKPKTPGVIGNRFDDANNRESTHWDKSQQRKKERHLIRKKKRYCLLYLNNQTDT